MSLKSLMEKSAAVRGAGRARPPEGFGPIVLPLSAYYGQDPEQARRRAEFYGWCASAFDFEGWRLKPKPLPQPEKSEQRRELEKYGHEAIASFRNNLTHPLEFLEYQPHLLQDSPDDYDAPRAIAEEHALAAGRRRVQLARYYYDLKMAAEVTPLASIDFERAGGSGYGPRSASDWAVDAMKALGHIHRIMPQAIRLDLEETFYQGKFIWDVPSKVARGMMLDRIKLGLDIVATSTFDMRLSEFAERWPGVPLIARPLPKATRSARTAAKASG